MIAFEKLGPNLLPRHGGGWIGIVCFHAPLNFLALHWRKQDGSRTIHRDAVPKILDQLNTLCDGKLAEFFNALAHAQKYSVNACRWLTAGSTLRITCPERGLPLVVPQRDSLRS